MRDSYPSDISRKQCRSIQDLFDQPKKKIRNLLILYVLYSAILYVLRSGIPMANATLWFPEKQASPRPLAS